MPFQIYDGRTGPRLILVNPVRHDTASVMLEDLSEVVVVPSFTTANGYPAISVRPSTIPRPISTAFRQEQRLLTTRLRRLYESGTALQRSRLHDEYTEAVRSIKRQSLLCANIVIGRELTLVLPKTMFTRNNRFILPAVTDLVITPSLAPR